ncbi:unnamed protein product, partial [Mesorhabditis spiculigera]
MGTVHILLFVFLATAFADYCPSGYVNSNGICLWGSTPHGDGTIDSARHQCALNGAQLPKITDAFYNSQIAQIPKNDTSSDRTFLIGVIKGADGNWTYADGTQLAYQKWAPGQPDNRDSCAIIDNSTFWYSRSCSKPSKLICALAPQPTARCQPGWIFFNQSCYWFQDLTFNSDQQWNLFNFDDAQQACNASGSQLVSIHSKIEADFVYDLVYAHFVNETVAGYDRPCDWGWTWIGLAHSPSPNSTFWLDGSPLDYCGFGNGDCVIAEMYDCGFEVHNDASCYPKQPKMWNWWLAGFHYSRYICKKGTIN